MYYFLFTIYHHSIVFSLATTQETIEIQDTSTSESKLYDIHHMEAMFFLKMTANPNISQEVLDDIHAFSEEMHKCKLKYIKDQLTGKFGAETIVKIQTGITWFFF